MESTSNVLCNARIHRNLTKALGRDKYSICLYLQCVQRKFHCSWTLNVFNTSHCKVISDSQSNVNKNEMTTERARAFVHAVLVITESDRVFDFVMIHILKWSQLENFVSSCNVLDNGQWLQSVTRTLTPHSPVSCVQFSKDAKTNAFRKQYNRFSTHTHTAQHSHCVIRVANSFV